MYLNKLKIAQLMHQKCNGNYNAFAREIGIDVAQLHRFLNSNESQAGPKMLGAVAKYCKKEGIDFNDYIFFEYTVDSVQ